MYRLTRYWLNSPFGKEKGEWAYSVIDRKLFIETMIGTKSDLPLVEYKLHMCKGKIASSFRIEQRTGQAPIAVFLDQTGAALPEEVGGKYQRADTADTGMYAQVLKLSEILGADFDYVRVDTYTLGNDIYFGELTIYSGSGFPTLENKESRRRWNKSWDLRDTWFLQTRHTGWKARYAGDLRAYLDIANRLSP
ncbi:MAG: ATP-grasp fold amidoligase family protein [Rhodobacterales bacterium]|nr:ATP-grasp fold amidoligase family protein [Rhodobacterales bacterium]